MADANATAPAAPRWPGETRAARVFAFDMDAETSWAFHTSMNRSPRIPSLSPPDDFHAAGLRIHPDPVPRPDCLHRVG